MEKDFVFDDKKAGNRLTPQDILTQQNEIYQSTSSVYNP